MPTIEQLPTQFYIVESGGTRSYVTVPEAEHIRQQVRGATGPFTQITWTTIFGMRSYSWAGQMENLIETDSDARDLYNAWAKSLNPPAQDWEQD